MRAGRTQTNHRSTAWPAAMMFVVALVVTDLAAGAAAAAERPDGWGRYRDRQFGMAFDFPSHVFSLKSAEQGRDGVVFSTPDGRARIRVFAIRNEANDSPRAYLRKFARPDEASFSYVRTTSRFFVASGTRDGNIFYRRCNFLRSEHRIGCFQMDYPATEKRDWDATVARISLSLAAVE